VLGPDGEVRWFATRGKVVRRDDRGEPGVFAGTVSDVDARKRLEAQLVLADRLAALGTLAGGVAHELNGPLSYVGANLDHVIGALGDPAAAAAAPAGDLLEALVDARDGVRTAASIIRDLRVLSRPNDRTAPLSPRAALEAAIGVARPVLAQRASLELSLDETPVVVGSHDRLVQVFVNLLLNAAQAVPDARQGAVSIRIRTGVRAGGRETFVEIEDQGRGIPAERMSRLFDPFFSTRPPGKGAGMGLAISHSIVVGMGGSIEVESRLGRGSIFRVVLPVAVDPPPTA
jgi:signal transduction histidine kinase